MAVTPCTRRLRVAVLLCHTFSGPIAHDRGQFDDVFQAWLESSLKAWKARHGQDDKVDLSVASWDVVDKQQYPSSLADIDTIVVTGSAASAYDDEPWIHKLSAFLQDVYANHPSVKIFGGCFGHQIIAQSLLGKHGVRVEANPKGWEAGVQEIALLPDFASSLCGQAPPSCTTLAMQFLHHDHVTYEGSLPPAWLQMGSSALCSVQGLLQPGRVLTYQGHPEFDRFVARHCVLDLAEDGSIDKAELDSLLSQVEKDDDRALAGELAMEFLLSEKDTLETKDKINP